MGMRSVLPEWYGHDDETIKQIVTSGTIALDANVMLDLYRVGLEQRQQILSALEVVRSRIFVPYQAALEFQRNRLNVAGGNQTAYENLINNVKVVLTEEQLNKVRDPQIKIEVRELLKDAEQQVQRKLAQMRDTHVIPFDEVQNDDPVLNALDDLLDDDAIGKRPSADDLKELKSTAEKRVKDRIPPGYVDGQEKSDSSGDYIIWSELLNHAKTSGRPLLFVTGDAKGDWYRQRVRGKSIGPRVELIAEMRDISGCQLYHQVPLDFFLDLTNSYLNTTVDEETIESVRNISRSDFFDSEALVSMYPEVQVSRELQDIMNAALVASLPTHVGLSEALRERQWDIAASLTLSPDFQAQINEVLRLRQAEMLSNIARAIPSAAEAYEQARRQIPSAMESYEQARRQIPSTLESYKQAQAALRTAGSPPQETRQKRPQPPKTASKATAKKRPPKKAVQEDR